jgi:hypothetical protein
MFSFFRSYRDAERAALAPLLDAALALEPDALPAFLADIRRDAPTVAARLEDLLARTPAPTPDPTRRTPEVTEPTTSQTPVRLLPRGSRGNLAAPAAAPGTVRAAAA